MENVQYAITTIMLVVMYIFGIMELRNIRKEIEKKW